MHRYGIAITKQDLLEKVHGTAIRLSSDKTQHKNNLKFLLDSLKETGDILLKDDDNMIHFYNGGDIVPTPHSAHTIAEYNEKFRHQNLLLI